MAECGDVVKAAELLNSGANVNHRMFDGVTPLISATRAGKLEMVEFLLQHDANVHSVTLDGDTALFYACKNKSPALAECLVEHGARVDHANNVMETPLHVASLRGHSTMVQLLLTNGAKVDLMYRFRDNTGTALHIAARADNLEIVMLLLANGADPSCLDSHDCTPTTHALSNYYIERRKTARCFLEHLFGGSDAWICNRPHVFKDFPANIRRMCATLAHLWSARGDAPTNAFLSLPIELLHALLCAVLFVHYPAVAQ